MPFTCPQCNQTHPVIKPSPYCTCKSDPKLCAACEADNAYRQTRTKVGVRS